MSEQVHDTIEATIPAGGYTIKTEMFEGPLDMLLSLIERRKLHISDISLAEIADDYIAYLEHMESFPLRGAAEFLVIASTLVLIKSRSLLPALTLTDEEERSVSDLEDRLKKYQRIKELSILVKERYGTSPIFPRPPSRDMVPVFSPTHEITIAGIAEAMHRVLSRLPKKEAIPQVIVKKMITLEEMTERLTKRISAALSLSFREFSGGNTAAKVDVIVGFLAMLELIRRGMIHARQDKHFTDIHLEPHDVGVPSYH